MNGVIILLLVACDFYVTKNITGRFLVSLRWWSVTDEQGNQSWRFESNPVSIISSPHGQNSGNTMGEKVDSLVFWLFTIAFPLVW